ncbi:MAG: type IV secretory system conjugative DNA transfer family protein, partial [Lachnospiraceae bacterium]|nr:type IV secretory system conjugative DNA transfer family protein [Lachnospiraceae bacterium]
MTVMSHPELAFKTVILSLNMTDISIGLIAGAGLYAAVAYRHKHRKNYRHGEEYGSARWGNEKDIEPFMDPEFRNNIPLTATERLMCSFPGGICGTFKKPPNPKYGRNKNVMIVGGSGSGKTRFYVKPSIMQMHSSYVVTDPKGTLILETGKLLQKGAPKYDTKGRPQKDKDGRQIRVPYQIRVFNTIDFNKSHHYNPLAYVHSEKDILKLVTVLMENTKGDGKEGDPFWNKAERLLLTAYIGYMVQNLKT